VRESSFIENIGIAAGQISNDKIGALDLPVNALKDVFRMKYLLVNSLRAYAQFLRSFLDSESVYRRRPSRTASKQKQT
jgi:hypothetical protein